MRQLHLILQIHLNGELKQLAPEAFFIDQLSAGLPLLQCLYSKGRVLFYCHFPDLLLVQGRQRWWKRLYRVPFDWLEQWSMSFADAIAVNSNFTKGVVSKTWPALARQKELVTVYPCVETKPKQVIPVEPAKPLWNGMKFILSINRFERKKNVSLAIQAFSRLSKEARAGVRLVVAGGYDNRVAENVDHHKELVELAESLGLRTMTAKTIVTANEAPGNVQVLFLLSVPNLLKDTMLRSARLLVYTPANEHFGIVPLEGMLAGTPILAADTGGPTETVVEGETGWLRSPAKVEEWTRVMDGVLNEMTEEELARMSQAGISRVQERFGEAAMAERLDGIISGILQGTERSGLAASGLVIALAMLVGLFIGLLAVVIAIAR
jgi:alpha-1,3/alpha-1,6-mannosyltransferase